MSDKVILGHERGEEIKKRVYKKASSELLAILEQFGGSIVSKRFENVVLYCDIPRDIMFPLDIVEIFKDLSDDEETMNLDNIEKALYLDWCSKTVWFLCYAHVIFDDIVDNSKTRYGKPCWHRRSDVGLSAVFDGLLIDKSIHYLMNTKFNRDIIDAVLEKLFFLDAGQTLNDMLSKVHDLDSFNRASYEKMVYLQDSTIITLPMRLAMCLAGIEDQNAVNKMQIIIAKVEVLFQMMNDYQDLFGDAELLGKEESDIQERKCSWFAVKCLEKTNPEQKELFKQNYGSEDPDRVTDVEALYSSLQMKEEFYKHKNDLCAIIDTEIASIKDAKFRQALYSVYQKSIGAKIEEAHF
ncbi:farnesyl pyrophosphate synthetase [Culex quinquefasciatus]|uniref:Farnesyl pyrophosphate synthetase n=1 Tax=Culex quinquefasciatus TaxID=7176 RepID=B0VZA9_CULQU|nr:farnesyl pyrophosphate synthetase [Culex quinquefasciatus]|eukprot:XP_001841748.1 farnesyl pyrophosphate synthetase [Culex quinquefasciatus]